MSYKNRTLIQSPSPPRHPPIRIPRTKTTGDDPYWEAVDLWYGSTGDLEWYDPQQITTRDGALVITMDSANTTQPGLTPGKSSSKDSVFNWLKGSLYLVVYT